MLISLVITIQHFALALRQAWRSAEFRTLATLVLLMLGIGTLFYHSVEGWGWLDSLYFCVITLATVGYGDFSPQTAAGKAFTIVYIFLGIGLLVTFFTQLAAALIEARRELSRYKRSRPRSGRLGRGRLGRNRRGDDDASGREA